MTSAMLSVLSVPGSDFFGSINEASAPLTSSSASTLAVKTEIVKSFGTVPATSSNHVNGKPMASGLATGSSKQSSRPSLDSGPFSIMANKFWKALRKRKSGFAGPPVDEADDRRNDAIMIRGLKEKLSPPNSSSDSGPFSGADAAIMADAFRKAVRKPDFAGPPVGEADDRGDDAIMDREWKEESSSPNSNSDSGPFSVADAAIMADAFRKALRKLDFAGPPVGEADDSRDNAIMNREWKEESSSPNSSSDSGPFSGADAAIMADAFRKAVRKPDFARPPVGEADDRRDDAIMDREWKEESSSPNSNSDSGPFSVADAAIMADAFRKALRKPDFAGPPVGEADDRRDDAIMNRELKEESSPPNSSTTASNPATSTTASTLKPTINEVDIARLCQNPSSSSSQPSSDTSSPSTQPSNLPSHHQPSSSTSQPPPQPSQLDTHSYTPFTHSVLLAGGHVDHNLRLWSAEGILEPYNAQEKQNEGMDAEKLGHLAGAVSKQFHLLLCDTSIV
jgi:hypothetical protein